MVGPASWTSWMSILQTSKIRKQRFEAQRKAGTQR
jgi:hypothetical protein